MISLQDELWTADVRESDAHVAMRALSDLQDIWCRYPEDTCERELHVHSKFTHLSPDISVTAHSGFINGFLTVIGRGSYSLPTGGVHVPSRLLFRVSPSHLGVIVVVVKGTAS